MCAQLLSCAQLFATPWAIYSPPVSSVHVIFQAFFFFWPFPTPGDLPNLGSSLSPAGALAGAFFIAAPPRKPVCEQMCMCAKSLELCLTVCDLLTVAR